MSSSTSLFFIVIFSMTFFMIIAEFLGKEDTRGRFERFINGTNSTGMVIVEGAKIAILNRYLTAGTVVGLLGCVFNTGSVSYIIRVISFSNFCSYFVLIFSLFMRSPRLLCLDTASER